MADYSEQPSKIENPQDINQYIRGELFILMDSILQYNQSLIPEDLILCKDALERYTLFFVQYIKTLPEFLVEVDSGRARTHALAHTRAFTRKHKAHAPPLIKHSAGGCYREGDRVQ